MQAKDGHNPGKMQSEKEREIMETREEKRERIFQELQQRGKQNMCYETYISSKVYEEICVDNDISLSTLRAYLRESNCKTKVVDWGDHQVLWFKGKENGSWGEFVVSGEIIEVC